MASRKHTLHAAAVLSVLGGGESTVWTVRQVAEELGLTYSSCYAILGRLCDVWYVRRAWIDQGFGKAKLHFELTDAGGKLVARLNDHIVNPQQLLELLSIEQEEVPLKDRLR